MSAHDESSTIEATEKPPIPAPLIEHASELDRRKFLKSASGLLLAFTFEMGAKGKAMAASAGATSTSITSYLSIGSDEAITVYLGGGEMGQGIYSGLAQGAAEDLFVDWAKVSVLPLPAALSWVTGGSSGIMRRLQTLRTAGATARQMLINAAAQKWNVSASSLTTVKGTVVNSITKASFTYGQLASLAATLPVPTTVTLVPNSAFQIIGQPVPRPDIPSKTNGRAIYGIDVRVPGMVFAVVRHCPTMGGTLAATPTGPTGTQVVPLSDPSGKLFNAVAVVASNTWAAKNAASQLQIKWTLPTNASTIDSTVFATQAQSLLNGTAPYTAEKVGNVLTGFGNTVKTLDLQYNLPYLAHACMEVLNCTVKLTATTCEIWAPTQAPASVQQTGVLLTGLPASAVTVYPMLMGGGLGRKIEQDYISQAIQTAKAIGKPVKLSWTREEDFGHDMYRPMALSRIQIGIDKAGAISAWSNRIVAPSLATQRGRVLPVTGDGQATEGATSRPYNFLNRLVEYVPHPSPVPLGYWRSVANSINVFAVESAIDEVALALKIDPLVYRQQLLVNDPRSLAVLNAAAKMAGWGTALPAGRARGIALSNAFGSIVAEVAEISAPVAGSITVHKVACAIDCGYAVNPNSVEAQMQGGILHGLSAALWGQVTFKSGVASARNFSNYRVLRMAEAPVVSVQIVNSNSPLGGVGEPGVPPIAPAVANAYAALTGKRIRTLPFFPGATMGEGGG
jgi:isoquinoline 1-oxidoreductase beta subunit